ncbi:homeodomain-like protein [Tanacetum coccineum]
MMKEMLNMLGFIRLDYGDYGRKMVRDVRVEIHGYDFYVDFVVLEYGNKGEPSVVFSRNFLVATKSQVDFGLGEMRIDITILKEDKDVDTLLVNLVEDMKTVKRNRTPKLAPKIGTFSNKIKKRIVNEQERTFLEGLEKVPVNTVLIDTIRHTPDYTKSLQELVSKKTKIEELSMVKLNARCSTIPQNELPPKKKDPRSFILPRVIVNMTVSNPLADLRASISVMSFFMFKRLGPGDPKPIRILIEMANKSMQSPKRIIENVLVKIDKFIFPMDLVILDIVEDDKVPIILGRPMLATNHARIDVFGKNFSLEVGEEKVMFSANDGKTPSPVTNVCAMNNFQVSNDFGEQENLEKFLMNDDLNEDLGYFLDVNDLLPENNEDPFGVLSDSESEMGINLDEFSGNIKDSCSNKLHKLDGISEFIEKGLTEILLGRPFRESSGLEESVAEVLVLFKIGDDKTIFQMPRTISRFQRVTTKQSNMMAPVLRICDEDKNRGFNYPYQKIKEFYKGCLISGDEYKRDEKVIEWIIHGHDSIHDIM